MVAALGRGAARPPPPPPARVDAQGAARLQAWALFSPRAHHRPPPPRPRCRPPGTPAPRRPRGLRPHPPGGQGGPRVRRPLLPRRGPRPRHPRRLGPARPARREPHRAPRRGPALLRALGPAVGPHDGARVRPHPRGAPPRLRGGDLAREPRAARRHPHQHRRPGRSARPRRGPCGPARRAHARHRLDGLLDPRGRDQRHRRGPRGGAPPRCGARRGDPGAARAARRRGRPLHEPRRPRAHRGAGRAGCRQARDPRPLRHAAWPLAVRTRQPLPVRHEPGLDGGRVPRDPRALAREPRPAPPALRGRPRDERARHLPDVPAVRAAPPGAPGAPAPLAGGPGRCPWRGVRCRGLGVLHPRVGRRLVPGLLRRVGQPERRHRDALRAGAPVGAAPGARVRRDRALPRGRARPGRGELVEPGEPGAPSAGDPDRLPRLSPQPRGRHA